MKNKTEQLKVVPEPGEKELNRQAEFDALNQAITEAQRKEVRDYEQEEQLFEQRNTLFSELLKERGYYYLINGVAYDLVEIGGNGWSIGTDSLIVALTGENRGKYYQVDLGGCDPHFRGEYTGPVPRPKITGQLR